MWRGSGYDVAQLSGGGVSPADDHPHKLPRAGAQTALHDVGDVKNRLLRQAENGVHELVTHSVRMPGRTVRTAYLNARRISSIASVSEPASGTSGIVSNGTSSRPRAWRPALNSST